TRIKFVLMFVLSGPFIDSERRNCLASRNFNASMGHRLDCYELLYRKCSESEKHMRNVQIIKKTLLEVQKTQRRYGEAHLARRAKNKVVSLNRFPLDQNIMLYHRASTIKRTAKKSLVLLQQLIVSGNKQVVLSTFYQYQRSDDINRPNSRLAEFDQIKTEDNKSTFLYSSQLENYICLKLRLCEFSSPQEFHATNGFKVRLPDIQYVNFKSGIHITKEQPSELTTVQRNNNRMITDLEVPQGAPGASDPIEWISFINKMATVLNIEPEASETHQERPSFVSARLKPDKNDKKSAIKLPLEGTIIDMVKSVEKEAISGHLKNRAVRGRDDKAFMVKKDDFNAFCSPPKLDDNIEEGLPIGHKEQIKEAVQLQGYLQDETAEVGLVISLTSYRNFWFASLVMLSN
ncbi:Hypothetical predicted protein, partial [Mytilus galloprovincialis]